MAKTAQVSGQMELNFTEQTFPKKRSIAKKSVSKPKKEIKKQIAFSSEHYEKAIEIVKEREIIHLGTLMRCLHISAMESDAIIQKMVEEELIGTDHRLISVKKKAWNAGR